MSEKPKKIPERFTFSDDHQRRFDKNYHQNKERRIIPDQKEKDNKVEQGKKT